MGVGDVHLLEAQTAVGLVRHVVHGDGVGQLADEVQEGAGVGLEKGDVARSATGGGHQRLRGREGQGLLVNLPDAD